MRADRSGGNMGRKSDAQVQENPLAALIDYVRERLEAQEQGFLIGLVVASAVVVITCGKESQLACCS